MISLQVNDIPIPEKKLSERATKYYRYFCKAFIERGDLQQHYLDDIETLAWYSDKRDTLIEKINENGDLGWLREAGEDVRGNGYFASLQKVESQLQKYKKRLLLSPKLEPEIEGSSSDNLKPPARNY